MKVTANWKGYYFKAVNSPTPFPLKYIAEGSWESTPKQREELKAYRDDNTRELTRVTAEGEKSAFKCILRENLHLKDVEDILNYFYQYETNFKERKIQLEYWCEEFLDYRTGYFYRPNMNFKNKTATDNDIVFSELELMFVEY